MSSELTRFDYFLFGMAYANHATYLEQNWKPGSDVEAKPVAYVAGMGEHLVYILAKVLTLVSFFFINLALIINCACKALARNQEQSSFAKLRLAIGFFIFGEAIPGIIIDAFGVICPPLAYRVHGFIRENFTQAWLEKLCVLKFGPHKILWATPSAAALTYLGKVT